jgi:competence protein ComGC
VKVHALDKKWRLIKMKKNEKGFTLIEMLIVMLVISVLLIITIPNVAKHNSNINNKGCDAYVKMVEAQVQAYQMEKNKVPTLADLQTEDYLKANAGCPNGKGVAIDAEGNVTAVAKVTTP